MTTRGRNGRRYTESLSPQNNNNCTKMRSIVIVSVSLMVLQSAFAYKHVSPSRRSSFRTDDAHTRFHSQEKNRPIGGETHHAGPSGSSRNADILSLVEEKLQEFAEHSSDVVVCGNGYGVENLFSETATIAGALGVFESHEYFAALDEECVEFDEEFPGIVTSESSFNGTAEITLLGEKSAFAEGEITTKVFVNRVEIFTAKAAVTIILEDSYNSKEFEIIRFQSTRIAEPFSGSKIA